MHIIVKGKIKDRKKMIIFSIHIAEMKGGSFGGKKNDLLDDHG